MLLLILFIILFCFFIIRCYCFSEIVYVKSSIDNKIYIIRRGSKSQEFLTQSADTLALINSRVLSLIDHLESSLPNVHWVKNLKKNYSPTDIPIISEAAVDNRYTTFTINKQDIHICLRTRDHNERIYDINLLMYVVLHELAHLCNYTVSNEPIQGHGPEFKQIFKTLVQESIKSNIYNYTNYKTDPQPYCGILINSSIM